MKTKDFCASQNLLVSVLFIKQKKTPKRTIDNFTINFLQYILFFKFPPSLQIKQKKKPQTKTKNYNLQ